MQQSEIDAVCQSLQERGVPVTIPRVRDELGRGSYSTLTPLVRRWKESGSARLEDDEDENLPQVVLDASRRLARDIYEQVMKEASSRCHQTDVRAGEKIAQAESEKQDAFRLADELGDQLERERAAFKADRSDFLNQLSAVKAELLNAQAAFEALKKEHESEGNRETGKVTRLVEAFSILEREPVDDFSEVTPQAQPETKPKSSKSPKSPRSQPITAPGVQASHDFQMSSTGDCQI